MIYAQQSDIPESDFVKLLEDTRTYALEELQVAQGGHSTDGLVFEDLVHRSACKAAENTIFQDSIKRTGSGSFPDIVAKDFYGIEVKATSGDKWDSLGNSIKEGTRLKGVERVYMFFGKLGGEVDIKYRPYEECLSNISVTHSPRYQIDMSLSEGASIFEKMGIDYDALRKDANPIKLAKEHYRKLLKEGEELWWIDQPEDAPGVPIIKTYQSLSKEEKADFLAKSMILFPEIFSKNQDKFERVAAYLVASKGAVSSNLRDKFSASGQVELFIKGKSVKVPRIFEKLYAHAALIKELFPTMSHSDLAYYWEVEEPLDNAFEFWMKQINQHSSINLKETGVTAQDIFEQGLEGGQEKAQELFEEEL